jgi:hypothetical protein
MEVRRGNEILLKIRSDSGGTVWDRYSCSQEELDMTQVRKWADAVQHGNVNAYEAWLKNVPWQLFCTFTFVWPVSDPQAQKVFKGFANRLERYVRGPIIFLRGDEKRFSGCGMPGAPRHFHALLAAHRKLNQQVVADLWMSMAGRRANGAGANVRIYDPSLGGLAYTLKFIDDPEGDWDLRNVDLFLSPLKQHAMNSRQRRRLARHARRLQPK